MVLIAELGTIDSDLAEQPVKGAVLLSGIYDLTDIRHLAMNRVLNVLPTEVDTLNPSLGMPKGEPFIYIAAGEEEGEELLNQSAKLAAVWSRTSQHVQQVVLPGADHFSIRCGWEKKRNPVRAVIQSMLTCIQDA